MCKSDNIEWATSLDEWKGNKCGGRDGRVVRVDRRVLDLVCRDTSEEVQEIGFNWMESQKVSSLGVGDYWLLHRKSKGVSKSSRSSGFV